MQSDPEPTDSAAILSIVVILGVVIIIVVIVAVFVFIGAKKPCRTDKPYEEIPQSQTNMPQHFPFNNHPLVLVIYSPDSPGKDHQLGLHCLVRGLSKDHIQIKCHDCSCIRQSVPLWLQEEFRRASTILCVCNAQFQREWDQEIPSHLPLVFSLQQSVYGMLNKSIPISRKFAIVLLRESDRKHIPCDYLSSTRTFLVTDVEDIALFVNETPKYATT